MKKLSFVAALLCASVAMFAQATAPEAAPAAPTYPANQVKAVYSATYNADCAFGEWGSGTVYTQEEFGKKYVTLGGDKGYFGLCFEGAGQRLNCSAMEKLHLDVWIAADASIRVVPIWKAGGAEKGVTANLTGGQWNSVDIALSEYDNVTDWTDIYQIKIDEAKDLTFWLNNVYFYTTVAPAVDTVAPTDFTAVVESASYFSAKIKANATDNSGAVRYSVINGELAIASGNGASGVDAIITVSNLAADTEYILKVIASDDSGNEAEPIEVTVRTLVAPAPAPVPTADAENVKSLFSDVYETATEFETYNQGWWMGPSMAEAELAENDHVLFYSDFGVGSCFGWAFASLDVTGYQKVHLSIYPLAETSFILWPVVQPEADYKITTDALTANEWNELVLDYTNKTFTPITQFGWIMNTAYDGFFVDNVYFFKEAEEGIDAVEAGVKARKVVENGQMIIIKNGVRYNALGAEVK